MRSRGVMFLPMVVACFLLASLIAPDGLLAGLASAAGVSYGLSAAWFYTGCAEPIRLLLWSTLSRLLPLAVGLGVAISTGSIYLYLLSAIVAGIIPVFASSADILKRNPAGLERPAPTTIRSILRRQLPALVTTASATIYVSMPLPIVALVAPHAAAPFAAGQSLLHLSNALGKPLTQTFQAWVPSAAPDELRTRVFSAIRLGTLLSIGYGIAWSVVVYVVSDLLSGGVADVGARSAGLVGIVVASISLSQIVGLACLTTMHRVSALMKSTLLGGAVGLALLPVGTLLGGAAGAWAALACAELAVAAFQVAVVFRHFRYRSSSSGSRERE